MVVVSPCRVQSIVEDGALPTEPLSREEEPTAQGPLEAWRGRHANTMHHM